VIEGLKNKKVIYRIYITFHQESATISIPRRVRRWMKQ
jgi:hypothetical protein